MLKFIGSNVLNLSFVKYAMTYIWNAASSNEQCEWTYSATVKDSKA